jgi:hypothetical protein
MSCPRAICAWKRACRSSHMAAKSWLTVARGGRPAHNPTPGGPERAAPRAPLRASGAWRGCGSRHCRSFFEQVKPTRTTRVRPHRARARACSRNAGRRLTAGLGCAQEIRALFQRFQAGMTKPPRIGRGALGCHICSAVSCHAAGPQMQAMRIRPTASCGPGRGAR